MPRQVHKTPDEITEADIRAAAISLLSKGQILDSTLSGGEIRGLVRKLLLNTAGIPDGEGLHREVPSRKQTPIAVLRQGGPVRTPQKPATKTRPQQDNIPDVEAVRIEAIGLISTGKKLDAVTSFGLQMKRSIRALLSQTAGTLTEERARRQTPVEVPVIPDFFDSTEPANGNSESDTTKKR